MLLGPVEPALHTLDPDLRFQGRADGHLAGQFPERADESPLLEGPRAQVHDRATRLVQTVAEHLSCDVQRARRASGERARLPATASSWSLTPASPCSSVSCSSRARRLRSARIAWYCCSNAGRCGVTDRAHPDGGEHQDNGDEAHQHQRVAERPPGGGPVSRDVARRCAAGCGSRAAGPTGTCRRPSPRRGCPVGSHRGGEQLGASTVALTTTSPIRTTSTCSVGPSTTPSSCPSSDQLRIVLQREHVLRERDRGGFGLGAQLAQNRVAQRGFGGRHRRKADDVDDVARLQGRLLGRLDPSAARRVPDVDDVVDRLKVVCVE